MTSRTSPPFDLNRYLDRIGLGETPSADLDGLAVVQAAHLQSIPFENLDVLLGLGIDVEPVAVFDKLVARGRGGYCFECNTLLRDALRAIGFEARLRLGRVIMDRLDAPVPPRTHAVVEVRLDGVSYVADCGFGAQSPRAPLRLVDGATGGDMRASPGGWRLQADPEFGWRLVRTALGEAPRDLYVFDESRVYPLDIGLGNHWTSTHPTSGFVQRVIAVRHTDDGRIVVTGRRRIEYVHDVADERPIESADDLVETIRGPLGIALDVDARQRDRLWASSEMTPGRP